MNEDFFRYKKRCITFILLLGYAFMHLKLTGYYYQVTLDKVADFSVPLPFAQRLLAPMMVHFGAYFLHGEPDKLFFLIEWLFISLFYFAMRHLMQYEFNFRQSQLLSWLFLLLLPLNTVINYRFSTNGQATFFFPYDTPSLFFLTLGFLLCLREKWLYLVPLIFIATINRETSLLLVLMIPALHWQKRRVVYKPIFFALIAYFLARGLVLSFLQGTPGGLMEWYFRGANHTHFEVNLYWLLEQQHILLFLFCFAGLPFLWFVFYDYIPLQFRPLRYVALLYFLALLLIGNFPEIRLFSEVMVVLYLPVCIALKKWLCNLEPIIPEQLTGVLYFIDRYSVLATLLVVVIFRQPLNNSVIWLSHL